MKTFALKLTLFLAPYAALFGWIESVFWISGETHGPYWAVERHAVDRAMLYGPAYTNPNPSYKYIAAVHREPEVLALGTSRVMQFRSHFLTRRPEAFYNAGGAVTKLPDIEQFLTLYPEDTGLKVLILGLDQYFFNPAWDPLHSPEGDILAHAKQQQVRLVKKTKWVLVDYVKGTYSAADLFRKKDPVLGCYHPVGLAAKSKGRGFRHDGSYTYGDQTNHPPAKRFEAYHRRIDTGTSRFEYSCEISQPAVEEFMKILELCRAKNLHVIGFIPPYAQTIYQRMLGKHEYRYVMNLGKRIRPLFERLDYPFFDFTDNRLCGTDDDEMLDGIHGSELTYLRIFMAFLKRDPVLAEYADREALDELLLNMLSVKEKMVSRWEKTDS